LPNGNSEQGPKFDYKLAWFKGLHAHARKLLREGVSLPGRLKIGLTDGDTVQRIAAQIGTSTPDKPMLVLEIRTSRCRALERAIHGTLEARGQKIVGDRAEWFRCTRDELLAIYRFVMGSDPP
jgi:hypothetical protein